MTKPSITAEQLASVDGLPSREAAKVLGVGKSTINDARDRRRANKGVYERIAAAAEAEREQNKYAAREAARSTIESREDGSLLVETTGEIPQTKDDIIERMRTRGFDPDAYTFTYRFSEWEAQIGGGLTKTMYAARAGAVERKVVGGGDTFDAEQLAEIIRSHALPVAVPEGGEQPEVAPNTFVFCFADPQLGKVDLNGGTDETVKRFLNSLTHAEALLEAEPATQIVWADLGDGIENFCNTSSQRQTNDLNLVEQVRVLRRLQVEGLIRLAKFAPVVHVTVPSNHSQNRVGFQSPASTAHDDWGIEVQAQIQEAFLLAGENVTAHPVSFVRPDEHLESVSITTEDGCRLGFVHGHRAGQQNGLERWWAGQSLGRQPTHDADILLVGHFHNLSITSAGNERYIFVTPSLDNGSSWWTVSRGNVATAGVATFRTQGRKWRDMVIV